ncbi:hypothetical protein HW115_14950 [Verrucomicrobiaceae bacterium N1E253]|uniref:Uncharacterized protein n=1 Tax=Oceaniferula marina TaxID=2748318 RepID=A0A851GQ23_9BACT|nr:hypothetical protein [Oceaniferula marina]NWK56920.1 hypothetical protein [Oceaniferula marina]
MLSDLLTSSRGPGVIGTLLALIVLLGFGGLFLFVVDDTGPFQGDSLAGQIKMKKKAIVARQKEIVYWNEAAVEYEQRRQQKSTLAQVERKVKQAFKDIEWGKQEVAREQTEISDLQKAVEAYKKEYRIVERERAVGEKLESFTTKSGKTYERVTIKEVSPHEMRFSHKNGNSGVHYEELPDDLYDRFQFIKEDAELTEAKAQKQIDISKTGGERYRISKEIMDRRNKISQNKENISRWQMEIQRKESEIASGEVAIQSAENKAQHYRELYAAGRRGLTLDSAKKQERKADLYRKRNVAARTLISTNRRNISSATSKNRKLESEVKQYTRELKQLN